MKGISDIDKLGLIQPQKTGNTQTGSDGDLFRKTFEKALAGSEMKAGAAQATSGLGEIQSFGIRLDTGGDGVLEKGTDRLLTLLDQYSDALNDPGQSLKDMEPLVKSIKQEAEYLADAVKRGSEASDGVKNVAEKSALLANVEYVKFMRGDYL